MLLNLQSLWSSLPLRALVTVIQRLAQSFNISSAKNFIVLTTGKKIKKTEHFLNKLSRMVSVPEGSLVGLTQNGKGEEEWKRQQLLLRSLFSY